MDRRGGFAMRTTMRAWSVRAGIVAALAWAIAPMACSSKGTDAPAMLPRARMLDPEACKECHADHYREWSGSMHAYASDDPVFRAMNARGQRETNGALGTFCVNCHAPMAVREGATDGKNVDAIPASLKGVTCFFCHSVDAVTGAHDNPLHLADDLVVRGQISDPVANTAHRAAYSPLHDRDRVDSAQLCGACHDIVSPAGGAIERTFQEWQGSVFSHAPYGTTCGQCHMSESLNLQPIAQAPNVFARRYHSHAFPAVDLALTPFPEADAQRALVQSFLDPTLQTGLCVTPRSANSADIRVVIDNVAAGHDFPSGSSQDRRLWFEVIAYKAGLPVYQSGVVAKGASPLKTDDADMWLLRDCMFDEKGNEVSMFWQAASVDSTLLPAQLTFDQLDPRFYQSHIEQTYPRVGRTTFPAMPDRVTLRVRLQPIGVDVLQDLVDSHDLDPAVRDAMPTFDIGALLEWTEATATQAWVEDGLPVSCVTTTNLKVSADKVLAQPHARCKP
jgi:hypothetical protein